MKSAVSSSQFRNAERKNGNRHLRGQVAIEYLMNYGWALLVLAIVIGFMLFSGVFDPNYFVVEECYLGPSLTCQAQLAGGSPSVLYFRITNAAGFPVKIHDIYFTGENMGASGYSTSTLSLDYVLNNSVSKVTSMSFPGPSQPLKNSVRKIMVNVTYYICAEEVNPGCTENLDYFRTATGWIVTKAL